MNGATWFLNRFEERFSLAFEGKEREREISALLIIEAMMEDRWRMLEGRGNATGRE